MLPAQKLKNGSITNFYSVRGSYEVFVICAVSLLL